MTMRDPVALQRRKRMQKPLLVGHGRAQHEESGGNKRPEGLRLIPPTFRHQVPPNRRFHRARRSFALRVRLPRDGFAKKLVAVRAVTINTTGGRAVKVTHVSAPGPRPPRQPEADEQLRHSPKR